MYRKTYIGQEGECISVDYLEINNYIVIDRNFRTRQGEIDIIAKQNDEIVFIEVKTRTSNICGVPAEAVGNIKQKHLRKCIEYYLFKNKLENSFVRIDVIEVGIRGKKCEINHIKNAIIF